MHQVTAMEVDIPRFSFYGWFLKPGKLYDIRNVEFEDTSKK